jgi:hypothetical protein
MKTQFKKLFSCFGGDPRAAWACLGVASARCRIPFLLAGWLSLVPPLHADNPPTYLFEIDASAVPDGFFSRNSVALDSSYNVYLADYYNNHVEKFTSSGNHLTQWGSLGTYAGQFYSPEGIAVDSSNNVLCDR